MEKELTTQRKAKELAGEFAKTGSLEELIRETCSWAWWFGRYGRHSRVLFQEFLIAGLKEVKQ
jgi:hypothetical protein